MLGSAPHPGPESPPPALESLDARRVHCADDNPWISERPDVERLAIAEWKQLHLAPATVIDEVRYACEESLRATERLQGPCAQHASGVSPWSTIGSAAGTRRQATHDRCAR